MWSGRSDYSVQRHEMNATENYLHQFPHEEVSRRDFLKRLSLLCLSSSALAPILAS
jgi:hypothetical protein